MAMKTPGVYIVEKSAFPNSVVQVETAVPAFIGYTQRANRGSGSLLDTPTKINTLAEYQDLFGGPPSPTFRLQPAGSVPPLLHTPDADLTLAARAPQTTFTVPVTTGAKSYELVQTNPAFALYAAIKLFYFNGGQTCYVTSIGSYDDAIDATKMHGAIEALKQVADATLVVIPETTRLSRKDAASVQQAMLTHCGVDMRNRFAILDIHGGDQPAVAADDPVAAFRSDIGTTGGDYAATYYPWLVSSLFEAKDFDFEDIEPSSRPLMMDILTRAVGAEVVDPVLIQRIGRPQITGSLRLEVAPGHKHVLQPDSLAAQGVTGPDADIRFDVVSGTDGLNKDDAQKLRKAMGGEFYRVDAEAPVHSFTQSEITSGKIVFHPDAGVTHGTIRVIATDTKGRASGERVIEMAIGAPAAAPTGSAKGRPADVTQADHALRLAIPAYADIMKAIASCVNVAPPSGAIAGIYTAVVTQHGVWKAPANVSLASVVGPTFGLSQSQQDNLNDPILGATVNAIRLFVGEDTLVWGARTLDGGSNDFRYVNVRRTMIMIEESIKIAVKAYVFEPNTQSTWTTIKSMIENFLSSVWKDGGLAGFTRDEAFSVGIGPGETMTPDDVVQGRLNITVAVAVTRPAEFIFFTISQQMQTS